MHFSQIKESKYLKKEDCGKGILVTITELTQENVAKQGDEPDMKYCLWFEEQGKPLVLNTTNAALIKGITGEEDTDNWIGHKIVLYEDPNIMFAGKLVGGIRVRAPKNKPAPAPASTQRQAPARPQPSRPPVPQDDPEPGEEDDVPF